MTRKTILIIFTVSCAVFAIAQLISVYRGADQRQRVLNNLKQRPDDAETDVRLWLQQHPLDHETHFRFANHLKSRRRFQEASQILESVPNQITNPWHERCLQLKAELHERLGRLTSAVAVLEILLRRRPDNEFALRKLAEIYAGCGRSLDSVLHLKQLVTLNAARRIDLIMLAANGRWLYSDSRLLAFTRRERDDRLVKTAVRNADIERRRNLSDDTSEPASDPDFVSALKADPWNRRLIYEFADRLRANQPDVAGKLIRLAERLEQIENLARSSLLPTRSPNDLKQLCNHLVDLGRTAEVRNWMRILMVSEDTPDWTLEQSRSLSNANPYVHPINLAKKTTPLSVATAVVSLAPADFVEQAADVGLNFRYQNGLKNPIAGVRMHQWTGGGLGVIDINNDDWPDLYVSQSGTLGQPTPKITDQLFVNQQGIEFRNRTSAIKLVEGKFGQGVGVGDFNQDGFEDLVVANIGTNRLLMNLGDGTFEATDLPGPSVWTTSVAIGDLNQDFIPDIVCVNYVGGDQVFQQLCDHLGEQRTCGPGDFSSEPDTILFGCGNDQWRAVPVSDPDMEHRGMGLVIGPWNSLNRNSAYVANDEGRNGLLTVGEGFDISDEAMMAGIAVDARGRRQGSMGIASSDFNGDSHPDLFVTNYYAETNNLFASVGRGLFQETTRTVNLANSSLPLLGFGAAAIDANADGLEDLIFVNGHLDDFRHKQQPFRMPTRLLLNTGPEFTDSSGSPFFQQKILGRSLAVWDWNRDGRMDAVVLPIDDPLFLLTNKSAQRLLRTKLIGTLSPRNPVGVQVTNGRQTRWLFSGGGYQASHETAVMLPASENITVLWPAGESDSVNVDSTVIHHTLIEGRTKALTIPD